MASQYVFNVPNNGPVWTWDATAGARAVLRTAHEMSDAAQYRLQNRGLPILQPMTKQQV